MNSGMFRMDSSVSGTLLLGVAEALAALLALSSSLNWMNWLKSETLESNGISLAISMNFPFGQKSGVVGDVGVSISATDAELNWARSSSQFHCIEQQPEECSRFDAPSDGGENRQSNPEVSATLTNLSEGLSSLAEWNNSASLSLEDEFPAVEKTSPGFVSRESFFSFARLFWNQICIALLESPNLFAMIALFSELGRWFWLKASCRYLVSSPLRRLLLLIGRA